MKTKTKQGAPVRPPADADNIVAELRRRTGWSQLVIAEKIGTTRTSISRYENGQRSIPGPVRVLICQLLEQARNRPRQDAESEESALTPEKTP